jgi:hypothetical protein
MIRKIITLVVLLLWSTLTLFAQEPLWINNTPKELNRTYKLVEIVSYGSNLEGARIEGQKKLAANEQLVRSVNITVDREGTQNINQTFNNGQLNEVVNNVVDVKTTVRGKEFTLQAGVVDEYATHERELCKLHTLYMVAVEPNPVFDNVYLTTNYGFSARALIPGWSQLYKRSTVKGLAILASQAATIGGIVFTENERASYYSKMRTQPNFARQYKSKVDNYETARNCFIGAATAVYLYNLIDAIVAPGARRVIINPRNLNISPVASNSFNGFSLSYNY